VESTCSSEKSVEFQRTIQGCVRGGPNQPLHRDLQWSIVLTIQGYSQNIELFNPHCCQYSFIGEPNLLFVRINSVRGKTPTLLGPLERDDLNHWIKDGNRSSFRNPVCSSFQNTGRWTKSQNPVILSFMRYRQNPLESA
jgi:hypothetical protein